MEDGYRRIRLDDIQLSSRHTLQDDFDAAMRRIEQDIRAHQEANLGEHPTKPFKVTITLSIEARSTDYREISGHVGLQAPSLAKTHTATVVGVDGTLQIGRPAGQDELPLERGVAGMKMVG